MGSIPGSLSFTIVQGSLDLLADICLNVKKVGLHQVAFNKYRLELALTRSGLIRLLTGTKRILIM